MSRVNYPIQGYLRRRNVKPSIANLALEQAQEAIVIIPGVGSGAFAGAAAVLNDAIPAGVGSGEFLGYYPPTYLVSGSGGNPGPLLLFGLLTEQIMTVDAGAGTFAGYVPALSEETGGTTIAVPAGSGNFTGYALTWNDTFAIGAGSGTFTGYALTQNFAFAIGSGSGTFAGYAPAQNLTFAVGAGSGTFTGYALTWNETLPIGVGSGTFTGYIPAFSESSGGVAIEVPVGSGTFTGYAPALALTENQWITPAAGSGTFAGYSLTQNFTFAIGAGSGAFVGYAPARLETFPVGVGSGTFSGYVPAMLVGGDLVAQPDTGTGAFTGYAPSIPSTIVAEEQYSGGWYMARYEQQALRRRHKRKKLEEAIESEISALIREEPAVPAETVVPEYVAEIRALIDEGIRKDQEFRRFIDGLKLKQSQDELARLLAIDAAIRQYIRQRDEEEFIHLLMLAA